MALFCKTTEYRLLGHRDHISKYTEITPTKLWLAESSKKTKLEFNTSNLDGAQSLYQIQYSVVDLQTPCWAWQYEKSIIASKTSRAKITSLVVKEQYINIMIHAPAEFLPLIEKKVPIAFAPSLTILAECVLDPEASEDRLVWPCSATFALFGLIGPFYAEDRQTHRITINTTLSVKWEKQLNAFFKAKGQPDAEPNKLYCYHIIAGYYEWEPDEYARLYYPRHNSQRLEHLVEHQAFLLNKLQEPTALEYNQKIIEHMNFPTKWRSIIPECLATALV